VHRKEAECEESWWLAELATKRIRANRDLKCNSICCARHGAEASHDMKLPKRRGEAREALMLVIEGNHAIGTLNDELKNGYAMKVRKGLATPCSEGTEMREPESCWRKNQRQNDERARCAHTVENQRRTELAAGSPQQSEQERFDQIDT